MTVWSWLLIALCTAGILLALVASAMALAGVLRLNTRLSQLRESSFVTKLESLQIQIARLSRISQDAERLQTRAEKAIAELQAARRTSGFDALADAWRSWAMAIKEIAAELS